MLAAAGHAATSCVAAALHRCVQQSPDHGFVFTFGTPATWCQYAGAERHYTHSYATFLAKLKAEPDFACWLQAIETDLAALLTGPSWMGESNSTPHRCVVQLACRGSLGMLSW